MPFYQGDSAKSIGGAARVLMAATTYPVPTRLSEIINLTTYAPLTSTYGWIDIGTTRAPTQLRHSASSTEWRNEQFGLYSRSPDEWRGSINSDFLEVSQVNKKNLMLGTTPADPVAGESRTNIVARTNFPFVRMAILRRDRSNKIHGTVAPLCQWDGGDISRSFGRADPESIPITWTVYPDEDTVDAETGDPILYFDLDQV